MLSNCVISSALLLCLTQASRFLGHSKGIFLPSKHEGQPFNLIHIDGDKDKFKVAMVSSPAENKLKLFEWNEKVEHDYDTFVFVDGMIHVGPSRGAGYLYFDGDKLQIKDFSAETSQGSTFKFDEYGRPIRLKSASFTVELIPESQVSSRFAIKFTENAYLCFGTLGRIQTCEKPTYIFEAAPTTMKFELAKKPVRFQLGCMHGEIFYDNQENFSTHITRERLCAASNVIIKSSSAKTDFFYNPETKQFGLVDEPTMAFTFVKEGRFCDSIALKPYDPSNANQKLLIKFINNKFYTVGFFSDFKGKSTLFLIDVDTQSTSNVAFWPRSNPNQLIPDQQQLQITNVLPFFPKK